MSKVIAIDFDNTITEPSPYPIMGSVRTEAIKYIKKLYDNGYTLILWTCRSGVYLEEAISALKLNNIFDCFKYINEDGQQHNHRKVIADFYIDDRSCIDNINWNSIYDYIINNIK